MGAVTDASGGREEKVADGEADGLGFSGGRSNGVHFVSKTRTNPVVDVPGRQAGGADGGAGKARAEERLGMSAAPTHVHRGYSGGLLRGASGGILRGISGGIHLPRLDSITFEMTRLPEEDAGVQRHFTETKTLPETPRGDGAGVASDGDAAPATRSRLRKHLTAVGACSFGLRLSETVFSFIAIAVMCSNARSAGVEFGTLTFSHFQAYRYLVGVNVVVFVYSTLQFIQLMVTVILGMSFIPSIMISTWMTFGFDQLFSYLLLSSSSSAATVANMSYTGEMGVHLCSRFSLGTFCARADAAVTISFFTFLAMLSSTVLAIYRIVVLFKEWR